MKSRFRKPLTRGWVAHVAAWFVALAALGTCERAARAQQTTVTISMASAPTAPQLVGTIVFASKPGSPLLFTVGATGQSPLSFSATGLPSGVTFSESGTLTGTTPAAGSYPIAVTVTNSAGTACATITLMAQDTLAATPPMGWNSYDSFGSTVTENDVMQATQAQQTTLLPFGYRYVVVDYLWFEPEDNIDAYGRFLPSPSKFPSATGTTGFTSLAQRVHALGLSFGIHIMRGIPRTSVSANTPIANSTYTASQAGNTSDPCSWNSDMWGVNGEPTVTPAGQAWYDSILAQYAEWGLDFIKIDCMLGPGYRQAEIDAVHSSIEKTGRSIVLSLSPGPMPTANAADLEANANQWRMVNDFWDNQPGWSDLTSEFPAAASWQAVTSLSPGHWPDADMLPLGYLGPRTAVGSPRQSALSLNQQVTVMTLWGILPSPLIFGGDEPMLASDAWTTALLTNPEVIAVNQDPDGKEATLLSQSGSQQTWSRDLSGGRTAVAFLNTGNNDVTMSATFASLGVSPQSTVRDVWHRTDLTVSGDGPSVNVPYEGAVFLVITSPGAQPAQACAGDASADAAPAGSSGGSNEAGTNAGQDASSGSSGGGSSGGGADGSANGSSGASPSTGSGGPGCSCRLAPDEPSGGDRHSGLTFAAVAAFAAWGRTRRKPWPEPRRQLPDV